jgi:hypothetical protein
VIEDITTIFLGIFTGLLTAVFTVKYTHTEDERLKFNDSITSLFDEIEFNRNKLPRYIIRMNKVREIWSAKKRFEWINENEVSSGYRGYLHNYFKFDSYNNFMSVGLNAILDHDLDYNLKMFYHNCKNFCAQTQSLEREMRSFGNECNQKSMKLLAETISNMNNPEFKDLIKETDNKINQKWDLIELEYNKIVDEFKFKPQFKFENKEKLKIRWIDWHLKKKRRVTI